MKLKPSQLKKLHSLAKQRTVTASEVIRKWIDAA